ncbi:MAG: single-stranded-DNA-specific exonuclease RecJ, partial [Chlamydiia bacterium]|nr:single-stranded-DNA-specific exonuclease RecJ [Chlamydiia bacterium]
MLNSPLWVYPSHNPQLLSELKNTLNIPSVVAQVLISRGFTSTAEVHEFLYGKLPQLYDPDLFPDMDLAVDRILEAIEKKEAILIYGDNDVDGMTAATLLTEFLRSLQANVFFDIPKREALKKSLMGDALLF